MFKNKKRIIYVVLIVLVIMIFIKYNNGENILSPKSNMNFSSLAFDNNGIIPDLYTCRGRGDHPPLSIGNIPAGTVSLAIVVNDPDAPAGDFVHWVVWGIDSDIREINNNLPVGVLEGENSVGEIGYFSPCPPAGTHHYIFRLYALDKKLELTEGANKLELEKAMSGHIIDQVDLIGLVSAN